MELDYLSLAQKIVGGRAFLRSGDKSFHSSSFVYKTTNEDMHEYQHYLANRKKVLTVISSSEQIFNQVVEGTRNIDIFDISMFPYFFFELKKAGVLTFSQVDDYCDFFYANTMTELDSLYDEKYDAIREHLDDNAKKFWDGLFQFYDWYDIYNSMLFSSEPCYMEKVLLRNKHLDEVEYQNLRNKISNVTITPYIGDINELVKSFSSTYDFINLSNIISYQDSSSYKKLLQLLPLEANGDALSYFYSLDTSFQEKFEEVNPSFYQFPNKDSGVMIYTKRYK